MDDGPSLMTLCAVTVDCPDPMALLAFYQQATGLANVDGSGEEFAGLRGPAGFFVGFQRVENYQPPVWPGQLAPQQLHLDFEVDDLDVAEAELVRAGAANRGSEAAAKGGACCSTPPVTPSASQPRRQ